MVPTGFGIKAALFYAVLMVSFFAAPYMNLFFLLLCFLSVVGGLAGIWAWRNLRGATCENLSFGAAAVGDEVAIAGTVRGGRRARYAIECSALIGGRRVSVGRADVVRGEGDLVGALSGLPRGIHPVTGLRLESRYPTGMFLATTATTGPEHVVIYPAPAEWGTARNRAELLSELCGTTASNDGELGPAGLREYRDGDELRQVHWKGTARRGDLVVREWEGSSRTGIEVCLDLRAEPELLEQSLSVVSALALWARENKEIVALSSQDHTGTYGEGHEPWGRLLEYLAGAVALPADGPPPPAVSPSVIQLPHGLEVMA